MLATVSALHDDRPGNSPTVDRNLLSDSPILVLSTQTKTQQPYLTSNIGLNASMLAPSLFEATRVIFHDPFCASSFAAVPCGVWFSVCNTTDGSAGSPDLGSVTVTMSTFDLPARHRSCLSDCHLTFPLRPCGVLMPFVVVVGFRCA